MKLVNSLVLVSLLVPALARPAAAQDTAVDPPPRAYLIGIGGAAANMDFEHPASAFAAEYGERVHRDVQAYANFSYVDNLMSDRMRGHLALAGETLTEVSGFPWEFRGRDRGLAFTMGAKYLFPANMRFRPYIGGGLGILNLKRRITERDLGDVSDEFFAQTGLNDGVIDAGETAATKPLAEAAIGVSGAAGRAYVDIAYKYRKAFQSFEPISFSQLTVGLGVAF